MRLILLAVTALLSIKAMSFESDIMVFDKSSANAGSAYRLLLLLNDTFFVHYYDAQALHSLEDEPAFPAGWGMGENVEIRTEDNIRQGEFPKGTYQRIFERVKAAGAYRDRLEEKLSDKDDQSQPASLNQIVVCSHGQRMSAQFRYYGENISYRNQGCPDLNLDKEWESIFDELDRMLGDDALKQTTLNN